MHGITQCFLPSEYRVRIIHTSEARNSVTVKNLVKIVKCFNVLQKFNHHFLENPVDLWLGTVPYSAVFRQELTRVALLFVCLCDGADGPHIVCDSVNVQLGQHNVCLRCHVTARPAPTSVYWQVGDKNTDVITDDGHWVMVQVNSSSD